jgi:hypothetical protein
MKIFLLEYYEEIEYEDFDVEKYSLVGVFLTEKEAMEEKRRISREREIKKELLWVSAANIGRLQWKGGFISV